MNEEDKFLWIERIDNEISKIMDEMRRNGVTEDEIMEIMAEAGISIRIE